MGIELGPVEGNEACCARWDIGFLVANNLSRIGGWRGWLSRRLPVASVVARTLSEVTSDADFNQTTEDLERLLVEVESLRSQLAAADDLAASALSLESRWAEVNHMSTFHENDLIRKRFVYAQARATNR